jgi:excisionase family DNA binding protein
MNLITNKQAAEQLGVSVSTVERLAATGKIAYYKIGSSKKFAQEDIEAYLRRARVVVQPTYENKNLSPSLQPQKEPRTPGRPRKNKIQEYVPGMKVVSL